MPEMDEVSGLPSGISTMSSVTPAINPLLVEELSVAVRQRSVISQPSLPQAIQLADEDQQRAEEIIMASSR